MPLSSGCSVSAFRENIAKMIREGRPRDQAVAAAISTLRRSCQKRGKPMPDIGEIVPFEEVDNAVIEIILAKLEESKIFCRPTRIWGPFDYRK